MAFTINYDCIACAACESDCPNEAISDGPGIFVIDATRCTECVGYNDEPQCIAICPVECILPASEHQQVPEEAMAA